MKKLKLTQLKVSSFQTNSSPKASKIKGGSDYNCTVQVTCVSFCNCQTAGWGHNCKDYKDKTL